MKTLAIRLEDEQHARLTILARLAEVSVTDAIRVGIEAQIAKMAADPEISARAESLTADIDREANEQRAAIAALFGGHQPKPTSTKRSSPRTAPLGGSPTS